MNMKHFFYMALTTALLTGGCAASSDVENLQRQIRMVNQKLENVKATTMDQLQKRQATASSHLDQLEQDIIQLRAQIEESYYLNQRLREQNKELEATISSVAEQESVKREEALQALVAEQKIKEEKIQQMLKRQQENVKAIQIARVREMERKAREAELEAKLAQQRKSLMKTATRETEDPKTIVATRRKVRRTPIEATVDQPVVQQPERVQKKPEVLQTKRVQSAVTTIEELPLEPVAIQPEAPSSAPKPVVTSQSREDNRMAKGKREMQQKKYQQALNTFESVAQDSTSGNRVAARFMMGECQFALKQYDLAVVHYQAVFSKTPGSAMAPQALMRQAQAFEKMADKDTAKLVYAKVIKNYGFSPQAADAKEKLKEL